jgi:hypothetical protein
LALLVAGIGRTNYAQAAVAAHQRAMHTDLLNGSFNFHTKPLLRSPCYSCSAAVRIKFELNTIADKHSDTMQTHFAGEVCKFYLTALKLHSEERIRKRLFDGSFHDFRLSHICVT